MRTILLHYPHAVICQIKKTLNVKFILFQRIKSTSPFVVLFQFRVPV